MKRRLSCLILIFLVTTINVGARAGGAFEGPGKPWTAHWIFHPAADPHAYGVFHFRNQFKLAAVPERFVVFVSGDNRYQLFVNGKRIAVGPARADVAHWRYETVDLAPALKKGKNTVT
ncbi:MAG TPA: hypothetical protein VK528_11340, partial [Flavobacterium sp.]|nr:hypothetical protein [Flavobacterium sp.]